MIYVVIEARYKPGSLHTDKMVSGYVNSIEDFHRHVLGKTGHKMVGNVTTDRVQICGEERYLYITKANKLL